MSVFDVKRIINACRYSFDGFKYLSKKETAFKQELVLSTIFIPLAFYLGKTNIEIALLCLSWFGILFAEITNSAIEACIDRCGDEIHPLSKRAKDIGSFAVLFAICIMLVTWSIIFFI